MACIELDIPGVGSFLPFRSNVGRGSPEMLLSGTTNPHDNSTANIQDYLKSVYYHAETIWLFAVNDLKTMVFPSTAFALFTGIPMLRQSTDNIGAILGPRIPMILAYTWLNLLAFCVSNQISSLGIKEDTLNKPWRPIPAGRLSLAAARRLSIFTYPIALLASRYVLGGFLPCILLFVFSVIYNDLGGGDRHWLLRNILNACGFTSFAAGALEVALQGPVDGSAILWLIVIGLVICTTVHIQDMYDQVGDSAAGRRTIPLIIGDGPARYTIASTVFLWTWICPSFWSTSIGGYVLPTILGLVVATRILWKRTVKEDRTTFKFYNAWLVSLYALPLMQVT